MPLCTVAQVTERQVGDTTYYKTLIPEEKQGLLKNMSLIANTRYALRNEFMNGDYTGTRYNMEQFRVELRGQAFKRVYFRWRNRFTKTQEPQSVDNLSGSVDLAYFRVDLNDQWSVSAGKLCADWGGYEFDYNPIDIYQYSDIIDYADNFLAGAGVSYKANPNHQFTVQVLNSRTKSFNEIYGSQPNVTEAKAPLAFVANWRGNLFDGKFKPIWSYSFFTEASGTYMHYITLGNQLNLCKKFTIEYDFNLYDEDLDRTSIVSETIPDSLYPYAVPNTMYIGNWLHVYYRLNEHINLALVGMVEFENWTDDNQYAPGDDNSIRVAYGYIPTIEYYPFRDLNFRVYANWVGRIYNYSDYAKTKLGAVDYNTGRFSIGIVTPLAVF
ncbi:MAG: OprO/OprP family phosphate-selective porin [Chitinophagales bacterium]|nr:OprO/OprP family phosphate-selective porin [Chitinophagales bacterium]